VFFFLICLGASIKTNRLALNNYFLFSSDGARVFSASNTWHFLSTAKQAKHQSTRLLTSLNRLQHGITLTSAKSARTEKMDTNETSLIGKVVFINGASRGIGLAIALELAKHGCKIVITGKTVEERTEVSPALSSPQQQK
jgi:hypothetical protein